MKKKYFSASLLLIFLMTSCQTIGTGKTLGQYFEDIKSLVTDKTDESENIPERERIDIEQQPLEPTEMVLYTPGQVDTSVYRKLQQ